MYDYSTVYDTKRRRRRRIIVTVLVAIAIMVTGAAYNIWSGTPLYSPEPAPATSAVK